jgi:hypothetical protein
LATAKRGEGVKIEREIPKGTKKTIKEVLIK